MPTSPHAYLSLGAQFLRLSYEVSVELVKNRNPHFVVSEAPLSPGEYEHRTRWADHMVGVAALFNLFHGIELILKGFLGARQSFPKHHRLTDPLREFDRTYPGEALTALIAATFDMSRQDTPLLRFFRANSLQLDQWYEALKYPEIRDGTAVDHFGLKYRGEEAAPFWAGLAESTAQIQRRAVALSHSLSIT